jgi:aspartate oxidase
MGVTISRLQGLQIRVEHPEAEIIAHRESEPTVLRHANYIGSTTALVSICLTYPDRTIKFPQSNAEKQLRLAAQTLNLIDSSYLILKSAAWRKESRGGHYRRDYPQTSFILASSHFNSR